MHLLVCTEQPADTRRCGPMRQTSADWTCWQNHNPLASANCSGNSVFPPKKTPPCSSRSGDRTLSDFQPLHPNSVKYRGDYNRTQSLLWALAEPTINATHTHAGQVRSRAVCFPAAVVLRVPAAGCFCTVRFVLRGWGAFRGATSFLSACFSAHQQQTHHGSRLGQRPFFKTPFSGPWVVLPNGQSRSYTV